MGAGVIRATGGVVGVAMASTLLSRMSQGPGDPFRGTLPMVPLVVAGLLAMERWAVTRGGRRTAGKVWAAGGAALALLLLLVAGRGHLALRPAGVVDSILAGGLFLLLALAVAHLLPILRPALGTRLPARPPWPFFALPLLVYLAVLPWCTDRRAPDGDEPYYLLIAHSLAYDFDTDLSNNYAEEDSLRFLPRALEPEWADPVGPKGERFSRHNMLLPLLLAPSYRLAGKWGAFVLMAALTAALAWMLLRVARWYWPDRPGATLLAWALCMLTPPMLLYSHQVWVEVPAALLLLLAVDRIHAAAAQNGSTHLFRPAFILPLLALPLLKLRLLLLAAPLLALAWWRVPRARRALVLLGLLVVSLAAAMLLYNQLVFDKPFKDHTWRQISGIQGKPALEYLRGGFGLFFDCAFGLFASNPLWLLLLPAFLLLIARRSSLLGDQAVLALPYLAVVSPRLEWYGAWSPPFRLGLVLLPLLALGLVPLLVRRRRLGARALIAALAMAALGLALLWLAVPGWTFHLADGGSHLLDYLAGRLGTDVARFFPSFVRGRTATWVWPPMALVAVTLLWWRPAGMRRGTQAGVTTLLLLMAALPLAAARVPTGVIEFEDRQVRKQGGELSPSPWVPARPRFRGGWVLRSGDSLAAPVASGGSDLHLVLGVSPLSPAERGLVLQVEAGERRLASWPVGPPYGWRTVEIEVTDWPPSAPLVLRLEGPDQQAVEDRLVVDRARLEWR